MRKLIYSDRTQIRSTGGSGAGKDHLQMGIKNLFENGGDVRSLIIVIVSQVDVYVCVCVKMSIGILQTFVVYHMSIINQ